MNPMSDGSAVPPDATRCPMRVPTQLDHPNPQNPVNPTTATLEHTDRSNLIRDAMFTPTLAPAAFIITITSFATMTRPTHAQLHASSTASFHTTIPMRRGATAGHSTRGRNLQNCMTRDDFETMCLEELTSGPVAADSVASHGEYASFLNGLNCDFAGSSVPCVDGPDASEFYDLPFLLQLHFVRAVCYHLDDNDADREDCMENMLDEGMGDDMFGFLLDPPGGGGDAEADVADLCGNVYLQVVAEGFLPACPISPIPETPSPSVEPTVAPTNEPTVAPTNEPTIGPTLTMPPTTAAPTTVDERGSTKVPTSTSTNTTDLFNNDANETVTPADANGTVTPAEVVRGMPDDDSAQMGPGVFIAIGASFLFLLALLVLALRRIKRTEERDEFDEEDEDETASIGSLPKTIEIEMDASPDPEDAADDTAAATSAAVVDVPEADGDGGAVDGAGQTQESANASGSTGIIPQTINVSSDNVEVGEEALTESSNATTLTGAREVSGGDEDASRAAAEGTDGSESEVGTPMKEVPSPSATIGDWNTPKKFEVEDGHGAGGGGELAESSNNKSTRDIPQGDENGYGATENEESTLVDEAPKDVQPSSTTKAAPEKLEMENRADMNGVEEEAAGDGIEDERCREDAHERNAISMGEAGVVTP